ncbi:MAG: hypothetical protein DWQ49_15240 [Bacteroidetes bacterium]|nr:MAG: hypothetical protein DWQ49_15240 [Bacteroidota bacterium]
MEIHKKVTLNLAQLVLAGTLLTSCGFLGAQIDARLDLSHAEVLGQSKSKEDIYERYPYVYSDTSYTLSEGTIVHVIVVQVSPNIIEGFTSQSGERPFNIKDLSNPEISAFAEFWLVDNNVVFWRTSGRTFRHDSIKWQQLDKILSPLAFFDLVFFYMYTLII